MKRVFVLVVGVITAVAIVVTQSGCLIAAAAGAAAGTVAYVKGDLEGYLDGNPEKVAEATKLAMADLKFHSVHGAGSGVDGRVDGRTAADKEVSVKIKSVGANQSRVWIRVGTFGDEAISRELLEKMKDRLGNA
jgi:hypothetical protein